jgi:lipoate-protein ligase A
LLKVTEQHNSNRIRLLDLGSVAAGQTQAVYHALAEMMQVDSPDTIIICRPRSPYLCLGYHQVYNDTLDRVECERRRLPVFRRRVGGGVTYLDANQLFYQCVFHHTRTPFIARDIYAVMLAAPVATLRRLGLQAELRAINEIEASGRRIAGIGGGRIGEASVVVGNLLFDFDYDIMTQVWRVPSTSFRDLAATALRDRVTTLRRLLGPVPVAEVESILGEEFAKVFNRPLESGTLTEAETRYSREVAKRLKSPEYLNLHHENGGTNLFRPLKIAAGVYIHAAEADINGYRVQASFRVRDGVIEASRLDSSPTRCWDAVEVALGGVMFQGWQQHLESNWAMFDKQEVIPCENISL